MKIALLGMNHKTAPVEMRERISLSCDQPDQPAVLKELLEIPGVKEGLYISTCNRVETLFTSEEPEQTGEEVIRFLSRKFEVTPDMLKTALYAMNDDQAIQHLFRVASSLDSMVVGEPQILGQIKDAYYRATELNAAGVILNRLLHRAFFVAKRVRTETRVGNSAVSISYAAVEMAKKIFDDLTSRKALLIGASEMAELAVKHLVGHGVQYVVVANRTLERAMELSKKFGGRPVLLEDVVAYLKDVDIVISSTGAPGYVVREQDVRGILRQRRNKPLFFIDIAVPRDIDPAINMLPNMYVYNIDELEGIVSGNLEDRLAEAAKAERIVKEESIKFLHWLEGLDVVPTIIDLQEMMEEIRTAELKKTLSHMKDLTPEQVETIEVLTRSITKKLLHRPIQFLKKKRTHTENKEEDIAYARRIFNLNQD
jgi:glutamyl-tRNA reductase